MLWLDIHSQSITMTCCCTDNAFIHFMLAEQFLFFYTMFFGKLFKIKVVKNTNRFPKVSFFCISELFGIPSHNRAGFDIGITRCGLDNDRAGFQFPGYFCII